MFRRQFKSGGSPAWQRKEGKSESGGLNRKGIASYRSSKSWFKTFNGCNYQAIEIKKR
jgi:hypothetical protein